MDVTQKIKTTLILLSAFSLSACSKSTDGSTPKQKLNVPNGKCESQIIKNSFVVEWANGKITTESAESREALISNVITPNNSLIKRVEHNIRFTQQAPTPSQCRLSGADNWGIAQTKAATAWSQGVYGDNIIVAVIDSGVDRFHPLLRNQIYINPGESGIDENGLDKSNNGIDDDNNGYIDDISGYDFIMDSPFVTDTSGHGTHVAGIIAAEHRDTHHRTQTVQGVAPGVKILPLDFINGEGRLDHAILAIDYARQMGARVINASWGGGDCSKILRDRVEKLAVEDVLFITAAGNNGNNLDVSPEFPAAFQLNGQITVGAIGPFENMAGFSNYSTNSVHLFAPGSAIESTFPSHRTACLDGTSMAAPFVAGAAALVMSADPNLSISEVRRQILNNVKPNDLILSSSRGSLDIESLF